MKKFILIALLVMALAIPSFCMAADTAHAVAVSSDIGQTVAIADASSGVLAEVSSTSGALNVAGRAQAVTAQLGDGLIYTGACRVQTIVFAGITAADYVQVYDAVTATGSPKFDIKMGTASDTKSICLGGAPFATGIYVDANASTGYTTVVYDY